MTIGLRNARVRERTPDRPEVGPGRGGSRPSVSSVVAAIPEPGDVRERRDAEGPAVVPVHAHERSEEVDLVLVADPALVQLLERVDEAGSGELGSPDVVEERDVGRQPFGDGVRERVVQRVTGHLRRR